jgi:uncharacterized protein (DUF433 family)
MSKPNFQASGGILTSDSNSHYYLGSYRTWPTLHAVRTKSCSFVKRPYVMENLLARVTLNPAVSQGKPTLRNMRFTVAQLLELLAAGMTNQEILADYPYLEEADIQAALLYAAHIANARTITPLPIAS